MGITALIIYDLLEHMDDLAYTRTAILVVLAVVQWAMALNARSEHRSVFDLGLLSNKAVDWAIVIEFGLLVFAVYSPVMQSLLKTVPLGPEMWGLGFGFAFSALVIEEIRKWLYRKFFMRKADIAAY